MTAVFQFWGCFPLYSVLLSQHFSLQVQVCFSSPINMYRFKSKVNQVILFFYPFHSVADDQLMKTTCLPEMTFLKSLPSIHPALLSKLFQKHMLGCNSMLWTESNNSNIQTLGVKSVLSPPRAWPPVESFWNPRKGVNEQGGPWLQELRE